MATKILTSNQLTFIDNTDQRQLSAYLTSNLLTIQTIENNNFNPSWEDEPLQLTPQVMINQIALNLSQFTTTWKRKDGNGLEVALISGEIVDNNVLTVNANNLSTTDSGMLTYICYITYTDTETNQTLNVTTQMTFTLLKAAANAKSCSIAGPQVFKYDKDGDCVSDAQITLAATVQNVSVVKWQYFNPFTIREYQDYPTTPENVNITSETLRVADTHQIFDAAGIAKIKLVTSDPNVYDILTISKIYDGATGVEGRPGDAGADAYTILLTNEAYTFPGTTDAAKESSVSTEVLVYQGTVPKSFIIKTVDGISTKNVQFNTKTAGLSCLVNGSTITFYASESLVLESGNIPIIITIDGVDYTKIFSWSVAYTGSGACSLSIEASSQIFKSTDGTTFTPDTITLTPIVQNLALNNVQWKYSVNGGSAWTNISNTTTNSSTVYINNSTKVLTIPKGFIGYTSTVTSIVFKCTNGEYSDSITVARLSDGQSASAAYTVILSNEMQGIATNDNLIPLERDVFECAITVYEGTEQLVATAGAVSDGYFKVVLPANPDGITLAQSTAGKVTFEVSSLNAIKAAGAIDLAIQVESEDNIIIKTISYAASKSGSDGTSPLAFEIQAPNGIVFHNHGGTLSLEGILYEGATDITDLATYQWYKQVANTYQLISGATSNIYQVTGTDVVNVQTYKCVATYGSLTCTKYATLTDQSDTYFAHMTALSGNVFKNGQGGSAVYVTVRANGEEVDPFPSNCSIGANAPLNPTKGSYWWEVFDNNVQLMKYNGSQWVASDDDPQQYIYTWSLRNEYGETTSFLKTGKVIYLSCADINVSGTLHCDVQEK